MKAYIDFSVFSSPTKAFGNATGEYILPDNCKIGDWINIFPPERWDWFFGSLKIIDFYYPIPDGMPSIILDGIVAPSKADAKNLANAIDSELGLSFWYY
jgi:hypothetical protein